jgi:hypothetical protein
MQVMPANAEPKNPFQWDTTQDLYFACKSKDTMIVVTCSKYLEGVLSMMQVTGHGMETRAERTAYSSTFEACIEEGLPIAATNRIFINWAESHPKDWGQPPAFGAWAAFAVAFPCAPPTGLSNRAVVR